MTTRLLLLLLLTGCATPQPTAIRFTPLNGEGTCLVDAIAYKKARAAQLGTTGWGRILAIEWEQKPGSREVAGHAVFVFEESGSVFAYTGKFQQMSNGGSLLLGKPQDEASMKAFQSNPEFLATRFMGARALFAKAYFIQ